MATLDFPANPTVGQEYAYPPFIYKWDGVKWKTTKPGSSPDNDSWYVNVTGDTMTGALTIATGADAGQLKFGSDNQLFLTASAGDLYLATNNGRLIIDGLEDPVVRVGSTDHRIYHEGFKPTAADVGALALTGGTLTGALSIATGADAGQLKFGSDNQLFLTASAGDLYLATNNGRLIIDGLEDPAVRVGSTDHRIYHEGFKPTPTDIGAVSKSGDTMSGHLFVKGLVRSQVSDDPTAEGSIELGSSGHNLSFIGINAAIQPIQFKSDTVEIFCNWAVKSGITAGADTGARVFTGTTSNGSFGIPNRNGVYNTEVSLTGSSFAPSCSARYSNTGTWGTHSGKWAQGVYADNVNPAAYYAIEHIDVSGGGARVWIFNPITGGLLLPNQSTDPQAATRKDYVDTTLLEAKTELMDEVTKLTKANTKLNADLKKLRTELDELKKLLGK